VSTLVSPEVSRPTSRSAEMLVTILAGNHVSLACAKRGPSGLVRPHARPEGRV